MKKNYFSIKQFYAFSQKASRQIISNILKHKVLLGLFFVLIANVGFSDTIPIRLHPDNNHYFDFRGEPTILLTSAEHYGSVFNLEFDYNIYLDELAENDLNLTRIFVGTWVSPPSTEMHDNSPLAPDSGMFLSPWVRAPKDENGEYADGSIGEYFVGGNKFDLDTFDTAYFNRLHDFIYQAGQHGVVVEVTFFSSYYRSDDIWHASPLYSDNNINGVGDCAINYALTMAKQDEPDTPNDLLPHMYDLVDKIVDELKGYDNIIYEPCNEPYDTKRHNMYVNSNGEHCSQTHVSTEWQAHITQRLIAAQTSFPPEHLIAQNIYGLYDSVFVVGSDVDPDDIDDFRKVYPEIDIFNFHYIANTRNYVHRVIQYNYNNVDNPISCDETGRNFDGNGGYYIDDLTFRKQAWNFLIAGGSVFDNLDFSYTTIDEAGSVPGSYWTGGSDSLRDQYGILKDFLYGFDFLNMEPYLPYSVNGSYNVILKGGLETPKLGRVLANVGQEYAIYIEEGIQTNLVVDIPSAEYTAKWVNTQTGVVEKSETFNHNGGNRTLISPTYSEDIALSIVNVNYNPPTPGLIGHWAFDETTGTVASDIGGNNLHGVLLNGPQWDSNGKIDGAVSCDGINDYVEIPDNDLLDPGAGDFTVSLWVYKRATTSNYDNIWGVNKWKSGAYPGTNEWVLGLAVGRDSDRPSFSIQSGTNSYGVSDANDISLNQWHLLTGVREGNEIKLYVDGVLEGIKTVGNISVNNAGRNVRIANSHLNNYYTDGMFDDLRIYNRALSAAEISALFQIENQAPIVGAGPDQSINLPIDSVTLTGTATDDGMPSGSILTSVWNKVSGPGNVVFEDTSILTTTASFSQAGAYQLELSTSDGQLTTADTMHVVVQVAPSGGSGAIGHWMFNELSGTTASDISGNNLHGVLVNGAQWDTNGKIDGAVSCDGVNDYIEIQDDDLLDPGSDDFTVSLWVYKRATTSNYDNIWGVNKWKSGAYPGTNEWVLGLAVGRDSDRPSFSIQSGTKSYGVSDANDISLNQWHLLTGVREGNEIKLYVDAVLKAVKTVGAVSVNNVGRNIRVANSHLNNFYTDGMFDDLRIYDRALTAAEISALFQIENEAPIVEAGPDQSIVLPTDSVTLTGNATDDGMPSGSTLTTVWNKVSGSGTVLFEDANLLNTTAYFSQAGTYKLELSASDGALTSIDTIHVLVQDGSSGDAIGHWTFNELSGTTASDISGNNLHGVLVNGAQWDTNGKIDGAVSCDGTNDYVEIPDDDLLDPGSNDFTVSLWVYKRVSGPGHDNIWGVNKWNSGAYPGTNEWALGIAVGADSDHLSFAIQSGTISYGTASDDEISLNQWHLLTGVREGSEIKLYVDGTLEDTKTVGDVSVNNVGRNVRIANSHLNNYYTDGMFDDLRIYDRALSASEISVLYTPASSFGTTQTYTNLTICKGDSVLIASKWEKQEGSYKEKFINTAGDVNINVTNLKVEMLPIVSIGPDITLNSGEELYLDAYLPDVSYKWQDESTEHGYLVTEAGDYYVVVSNMCGSVTSTVKINYNTPSNLTEDVSSIKVSPNPFTNSTRFEFSLSETEKVIIAIYNMHGETVKIMKNSILRAGTHELIWDGTNETGQSVRSGIYFVRIVRENVVLQKTVVKLK